MNAKHLAKEWINGILRHANMRIESLTGERLENERLRGISGSGHFDRPVFGMPPSFECTPSAELETEIRRHQARFADLAMPAQRPTDFSLENGYYTSPDAEVLYAVIRLAKPSLIVEVGSGNSTKLARTAIRDGGLDTRILSIDPDPRTDIDSVSDVVERRRVESMSAGDIAGRLSRNDILFIDSSHIVSVGNDVVFLYLQVLPLLKPGVLVHVHDFFAPYDYPESWIVERRWPWNEQYLVQAMLSFGNRFEVLWAGHYLQRTRNDFADLFPQARGRIASSLWLRTTPTRVN